MISKMYLLPLRFARLVELWYVKGVGITVVLIRLIDLLQLGHNFVANPLFALNKKQLTFTLT